MLLAFIAGFSLAAAAQNVIQIKPAYCYVEIPNNSAFHFTSTVTYEAKVNVCAETFSFINEEVIAINCISPDHWGFFIAIAPGRKARAACVVNNVTTKCDAPDAIPNDGLFHTISATRSGTTLKLYVDGVFKNSVTVGGGSLRYGTGINRIGIAQSVISNSKSYLLKDVRFWNTARTEEEIASNLNANLAGNETGLVGLYTFNQTQSNGAGIVIVNGATTTGNAANGITVGADIYPVIGPANLFTNCGFAETCNGLDDDDDLKVDEICTPVINVTPSIITEGSSGFNYLHLAAVLNLNHVYDTPVTVKYRTKGKTATEGSDYVAAIGKIKFRPGETQKPIYVYIIEDAIAEAQNEKFLIQFHDVMNATMNTDKVNIVIKDDDNSAGLISAKTIPIMPETRITLSPNPAKDKITITGITNTNGIAEIRDMQGKIWITQQVNSNYSSVQIDKLSPGTYIFSYSTGKEKKEIKFIKH